MRVFLMLFTAISLAACMPDDHSGMTHEAGSHANEGIVISAAQVVPPFPGRDVSAGYFELKNLGVDDRLISVSSPISPRVEMHTHLNEDGVMKMRKVGGVDLPSGEKVTFKPGSYHLMMFDTALSDAETNVSLTFNFETAPAVTVVADIEGRGEGKLDNHDGH